MNRDLVVENERLRAENAALRQRVVTLRNSKCGGEIRERKVHEQFVVDIPPVKPVVVRYVTESGYCARCQKRVRSRHTEQISDATGAAGVVIGPRAKALAADMKHRLGVSYGKVCGLLDDAFGLHVTRGGWCQADGRLAEQARPVYAGLVEALRASSVVHADETGWRIGTLSAWLRVFTNQETTVYTIRTSRGHDVVVDILGTEFAGILNTVPVQRLPAHPWHDRVRAHKTTKRRGVEARPVIHQPQVGGALPGVAVVGGGGAVGGGRIAHRAVGVVELARPHAAGGYRRRPAHVPRIPRRDQGRAAQVIGM